MKRTFDNSNLPFNSSRLAHRPAGLYTPSVGSLDSMFSSNSSNTLIDRTLRAAGDQVRAPVSTIGGSTYTIGHLDSRRRLQEMATSESHNYPIINTTPGVMTNMSIPVTRHFRTTLPIQLQSLLERGASDDPSNVAYGGNVIQRLDHGTDVPLADLPGRCQLVISHTVRDESQFMNTKLINAYGYSIDTSPVFALHPVAWNNHMAKLQAAMFTAKYEDYEKLTADDLWNGTSEHFDLPRWNVDSIIYTDENENATSTGNGNAHRPIQFTQHTGKVVTSIVFGQAQYIDICKGCGLTPGAALYLVLRRANREEAIITEDANGNIKETYYYTIDDRTSSVPPGHIPDIARSGLTDKNSRRSVSVTYKKGTRSGSGKLIEFRPFQLYAVYITNNARPGEQFQRFPPLGKSIAAKDDYYQPTDEELFISKARVMRIGMIRDTPNTIIKGQMPATHYSQMTFLNESVSPSLGYPMPFLFKSDSDNI